MWSASGGGPHILVASSSENLPLLIKSGGLGKEKRKALTTTGLKHSRHDLP